MRLLSAIPVPFFLLLLGGVCVWVETCVGLVLRVRTGMQTYIRRKSGGLLCCDVGLGGEVYVCV